MSNPTSNTPPAASPPADLGDIVVLNRDLFFGARIANTLRALGYGVVLLPDAASFATRVRESVPPPVLGIVDIAAAPDWPTLAALAADPAGPTPLLAFGPHKDVEGLRAAKAAGVTRVVSNGDFHRDMVGLVRRYAREENAPSS